MNINRLLETGAISGPYRKTRPVMRNAVTDLFGRISDLLHDIRFVWSNAKSAWRFTRHMRRGGNPDQLPF